MKSEIELRKLMKKKRYLDHYIQGFADAEGCFSVALKKQKSARFGWVLDPLFQVTQHKNNSVVLELIKKTLGCGRIIEKPGQKDTLIYLVDNRRQLREKIIPFFKRHQLIVKKLDFELFTRIVDGLEEKRHSKPETFKELIEIAFRMNMNGKQRRYNIGDVMGDIK